MWFAVDDHGVTGWAHTGNHVFAYLRVNAAAESVMGKAFPGSRWIGLLLSDGHEIASLCRSAVDASSSRVIRRHLALY